LSGGMKWSKKMIFFIGIMKRNSEMS